MKLILQIENNMKDATGIKKRVMFATLKTDIPGMEHISSICELDEECVLGKEITILTADLLALKKKDLELKVEADKKKKANKKLK